MKSLLLLSLLAVSAFAETLHVYTWADYASPDVVKKFEKQQVVVCEEPFLVVVPCPSISMNFSIL
jgi:spermidine/putrescine-binding protein